MKNLGGTYSHCLECLSVCLNLSPWLVGYCFTPYQRLWLYNGAPLVAFYDTLGIRRTYSRLKPPASSRGSTYLLNLSSEFDHTRYFTQLSLMMRAFRQILLRFFKVISERSRSPVEFYLEYTNDLYFDNCPCCTFIMIDYSALYFKVFIHSQ